MKLEEKMFLEVEHWLASGESKSRFLVGKEYSEAKFNYWLTKHRSREQKSVAFGFREVDFSEMNPIAIGLGKVLEIEAPSGLKITVFA